MTVDGTSLGEKRAIKFRRSIQAEDGGCLKIQAKKMQKYKF